MSAGRSVANVYCGTSDFAATVLEVLAASAHRPSLVVTPPDRKRGRGRQKGSPPVADRARELGIELHQTESINREESRAAILATEPELATVCAFGQLIKAPLIEELPMLNVHPSLLPRWRGAAPIERAILAGDERTGVCVMKLTEGLDSGPVGTARGGADRAGRRLRLAGRAARGGRRPPARRRARSPRRRDARADAAAGGGGHLRGEDRDAPSGASTRAAPRRPRRCGSGR